MIVEVLEATVSLRLLHLSELVRNAWIWLVKAFTS